MTFSSKLTGVDEELEIMTLTVVGGTYGRQTLSREVTGAEGRGTDSSVLTHNSYMCARILVRMCTYMYCVYEHACAGESCMWPTLASHQEHRTCRSHVWRWLGQWQVLRQDGHTMWGREPPTQDGDLAEELLIHLAFPQCAALFGRKGDRGQTRWVFA